MRHWALMLGGLNAWAFHFLAVYGLASLFPGTALARWLVLAVTFVALGLNLLVLRRAMAGRQGEESAPVDGWMKQLAVGGAALSIVAVVWQALPILF